MLSTFSTIALTGSSSERNARASRMNVVIVISAIISGKLPYTASMKSAFDAGWPPTRTSGPAACAVSRTAVERLAALVRAAVGDRDRLDDRGAAAAARTPGATAPWIPSTPRSSAATALRVGAALDQDLVREQRALADAGVLERHQAVLGVARAGDRVGVGRAELEVGGRERRAPRSPPCRRRRRASGAARRPRAQRVQARLALSSVRRCGQSSRGPTFASTTGSSVIATTVDDERDQHAAVAHRAQERQRQRDQRQQADRDRHAAEHDGAAGGLHGPLHGLVSAVAVRALLAPARDHQQRVVDRHAEPDQRDQELDDGGDRRSAR